MNENKSFYKTQSLPLAATLISLSIELDSVNRIQEGKFAFVFPHTQSLEQIIEAFWQRKLRVEPNSYWEAQRFLKSRIYGGGNG